MSLDEQLTGVVIPTSRCRTCNLLDTGLESADRLSHWVGATSAQFIARVLKEEHGDLAPSESSLRRHIRDGHRA